MYVKASVEAVCAAVARTNGSFVLKCSTNRTAVPEVRLSFECRTITVFIPGSSRIPKLFSWGLKGNSMSGAQVAPDVSVTLLSAAASR